MKYKLPGKGMLLFMFGLIAGMCYFSLWYNALIFLGIAILVDLITQEEGAKK